MFGAAYFTMIIGMVGAILYVGMAGAAPPVDLPGNGIGFILVMALQ